MAARRSNEELGGLRFRISPDAFFQTNTEMAERLYGIATEYAQLQGWERVYDLFCGIGTIGLSLAPRAGELFGLEIVEEAVADAIENARINQVTTRSSSPVNVRLALRELVEKAGRPDVLVVDPPRAGLSQKVRAAHRRGRPAPHRLRQLPTRPHSRPTPPSSSRPATHSAACARSTCPADPAHRVRGAAGTRELSAFAWRAERGWWWRAARFARSGAPRLVAVSEGEGEPPASVVGRI